MDNRVFNVKGRSKEQLLKTIECLLTTQHGSIEQIKAWRFDPAKGLILYWHFDNQQPAKQAFVTPPSCATLTDIVWDWLQSDQATTFKITDGNDVDFPHDGSNALGFRIYNEAWGKVNGETYSFAAIIPAYCWYGK